jgi:hypothetical protein
MKATAVSLTLLVLVGCSTMSTDTKPKGPVSQVTVYREPSSRDGLLQMLFTVDGRPIVQLQPEEGGSFELPAGDHEFQYELGLYNCSEQVHLEPGKRYVYRLAQGCVIAREDQP